MSDEAQCKGCLYWAGKPDGDVGTCHRYPPTVVVLQGFAGPKPETVWPKTLKASVCGEWKEKP